MVIPEGVTAIGNGALSGATFNEIIIPNTVTTIGSSAFANSGVMSISLPSSVTHIGSSAFSGCTSLASVTFASGSQLQTIEYNVFYGCTGLGSIVIPSGVKNINSSAFSGCTGLGSIVIPSGVKSINSSAFSRCTGLGSIVIPADVKSINSSAFSGCTSLASVTFASGSQLQTIEGNAFYGCTGLGSIVIPSGVKSINSSAFSGCTSLASVTFASGSQLQTIGYNAFNNCVNLGSIVIPADVKSVGSNAFSNTGIWNNATNNSVVYAGNWAVGVKGSISNPSLLSGTVGIADNAFYGQTNITSVTLPASLKYIGGNAFQNCTGITSIVIPASVERIGAAAFYSCSNLTTVTIERPASSGVITFGGEFVFEYCPNLTSIYVPDYADVTPYNNATYWKNSSQIKALNTVAWISIWSGNISLILEWIDWSDEGVEYFDIPGASGLLSGPIRVAGYWNEYFSYGGGEIVPFDLVGNASVSDLLISFDYTNGPSWSFDYFSLRISGDSQLSGEWGTISYYAFFAFYFTITDVWVAA